MVISDEDQIILKYLKKEEKEDLKKLRRIRNEVVAWLQEDACISDTKLNKYIEARDKFLSTRAMYDRIIEQIGIRESTKI